MTGQKSSYWKNWERQYYFQIEKVAEMLLCHSRFPDMGYDNAIQVWLRGTDEILAEWHRRENLGRL